MITLIPGSVSRLNVNGNIANVDKFNGSPTAKVPIDDIGQDFKIIRTTYTMDNDNIETYDSSDYPDTADLPVSDYLGNVGAIVEEEMNPREAYALLCGVENYPGTGSSILNTAIMTRKKTNEKVSASILKGGS